MMEERKKEGAETVEGRVRRMTKRPILGDGLWTARDVAAPHRESVELRLAYSHHAGQYPP
jgi:hypothetical protein